MLRVQNVLFLVDIWLPGLRKQLILARPRVKEQKRKPAHEDKHGRLSASRTKHVMIREMPGPRLGYKHPQQPIDGT